MLLDALDDPNYTILFSISYVSIDSPFPGSLLGRLLVSNSSHGYLSTATGHLFLVANYCCEKCTLLNLLFGIQFEFGGCQPPATAVCYVSLCMTKLLYALRIFLPAEIMESSFWLLSRLLPLPFPSSLPPV